MRSPIINENDSDIQEAEYLSIFEYLWYRDKPFTGTLLYEDGVSYIEFEDGCAQGKYIEYNKDGLKVVDCTLDKGSFICEKTWYDNGMIREDDKLLYDKDGRLIRIDKSWLYPNGQKINDSDDYNYYYFSPDGELAIKRSSSTKEDSKYTYFYYDRVLSECFLQLIFNYYPQESEFNHLNPHRSLWKWAMKTYSIDKNKGLDIFYKLTQYNNEEVARTASHLVKGLTENTLTPDSYIDSQNCNVVMK